MKPDPSINTADAIIGKKSVKDADQCPRVIGVSQMPDSEVEGRGTIRKLDLSPVDQPRSEVIWTNPSAESSFADEWTDLSELEHQRAGLRGGSV